MDDTVDRSSEGLESVLDVVASMAAMVRGNAAGLLEVIGRIDGICDRLSAVRMGLLHGVELVREPGLSVAERMHATNRISRRTSRSDAWLAKDLADRFPVVAGARQDGTVSAEQARGIVGGLKRLPMSLSPFQLERCQADVVGFAREVVRHHRVFRWTSCSGW